MALHSQILVGFESGRGDEKGQKRKRKEEEKKRGACEYTNRDSGENRKCFIFPLIV